MVDPSMTETKELRGDRNVYILGAGFSAGAGAPLVNDLLDRARSLYLDPNSRMDGEERNKFKEVFEFKQKVAQSREKIRIDLDNIEELFGLVEVSSRLSPDPFKPSERNSTVYLIAKTLQLSIRDTGTDRPRVQIRVDANTERVLMERPAVFHRTDVCKFEIDTYDFFAALISGAFDDPHSRESRKDSVITFNYDLILDEALRRVNVKPTYCLPTDSGRTDSSLSLRVLKLHGSTNWGICGECRSVGSIFVESEKLTTIPEMFRNRECPNKDCGCKRLVPLLIPPSWDKSDYTEIMVPVWNAAVRELKSATRIFVIGYSAPESDMFFKYLLTLGLAHNESLFRLGVVDLVSQKQVKLDRRESDRFRGSLEARYIRLLEELFRERRFFFSGSGFENFIAGNQALVELGRGEKIQSIARPISH